MVEQKRNVMAHAQKPDLVFQRNGRVHLYRRGCQFSRLLAADVCASAVVMLDRPCPIQCKTAGYPLHSPFPPSLLHPCVSVCHHIPFPLYAKGIRSSVKAGSTKSPYVYYSWFVNESHQSYSHHCPVDGFNRQMASTCSYFLGNQAG